MGLIIGIKSPAWKRPEGSLCNDESLGHLVPGRPWVMRKWAANPTQVIRACEFISPSRLLQGTNSFPSLLAFFQQRNMFIINYI